MKITLQRRLAIAMELLKPIRFRHAGRRQALKDIRYSLHWLATNL